MDIHAVNFLVVELLKQKHLSISTCESASCGALASMLGEVPGVSQVYKGGFVTYSNDAKVVLAEVSVKTLNEYGAISEQTAYEMAERTANILDTDIAISITGNAGPQGDENKPVGLFYVGITILGITTVYQITLKDTKNRDYNRLNISWEALKKLYDLLTRSSQESIEF